MFGGQIVGNVRGQNLAPAKASHSEPLPEFPTTQWSLVGRAGQNQGDAGQREALAVLLQRYLPALRAHLLAARRLPSDRVDDLLQGFVTDKVIEQNLLDHARREKGRFRSFLLVTLNHYLISEHRRESATMRAPAGGLANLDQDLLHVAAETDDPSDIYTLAWARELVAEALGRMQRQCDESARKDVWTIFYGRIVRPTFEGGEPTPYEQLVNALNLATPLQACSLLTTAKRMFARNLRAVVAEYADPDNGADSELRELREILGRGAESGKALRS